MSRRQCEACGNRWVADENGDPIYDEAGTIEAVVPAIIQGRWEQSELRRDLHRTGSGGSRRDEQMRAERYTVERVSATDVQRDVQSVVRGLEARVPPASEEEQQRLDEEATVLRRDEIAMRAAEPARTRSRAAQSGRAVRAMAYRYLHCLRTHGFRSPEKPMPRRL